LPSTDQRGVELNQKVSFSVPLVKAKTELRSDWRNAPLAYWVHIESPPDVWKAPTTNAS
jgi:hypothetical protein